jgi:hypothetical protein
MRTRTVTNLGEIPVKFWVKNANPGLTISPMEGTVPPQRRRIFAFSFRPVDETEQISPVTVIVTWFSHSFVSDPL